MKARLPGLVPGLVCRLCLAACASGPAAPIEYYVLAPQVAAADSVVERSNRPTLVIENVDLAAYLRQTGMIIQTGDNQILVSRTHLWAESLELSAAQGPGPGIAAAIGRLFLLSEVGGLGGRDGLPAAGCVSTACNRPIGVK